jgi:hypothetical protein
MPSVNLLPTLDITGEESANDACARNPIELVPPRTESTLEAVPQFGTPRIEVPDQSASDGTDSMANTTVVVPSIEIMGSHTPSAHDPSAGRLVTSTHEPLWVCSSLMARYPRKELYERVWTVPMRKLAKQYGVSDVALAKSCRKLFIPLPGRGYWAKKDANRPVGPRPPLPNVAIRTPKLTRRRRRA